MELSDVEARIVGSLIEKESLTPDIYPMTTNALVSACNQKTNRDPVVAYDPVMVDSALLDLRQRSLVRRVHVQGSRSTKHRHTLDEALDLSDGELAAIAILLLRGPQTLGEIRQRAERQHRFDSTDAVETCLQVLASRAEPVVAKLGREPGQKEARWQHLLGDNPAETPRATSTATSQEPTVLPDDLTHLRSQPARFDGDLVKRVSDLEAEVEQLRARLDRVLGQLGEPLD